MMRLSQALLTLTPLFLGLSSADSTVPLPPSQDPFYTAPPNYELATPGTVLRLRQAPGNLTSVVGNCSAAYHILYRTTSARFRPSWAVTTLYIPENTEGTALLSYQVPCNSPNVDFSPSYDFYSAPIADVGIVLGRGIYVNVPDHEGPRAAFAASIGEGHATLDSVRAVLFTGFGLQSEGRYAMWGYSGGALASEYAAELQEQYAPELNFSGAALGGTPANLTAAFDTVDGTGYAGLIPLASIGMTQLYPEAHDYLVSQLKSDGEHNGSTFLATTRMGPFEAFATFANQSIWDYFVHSRDSLLEAPILQEIFDANGYMGFHGIPQMPLFVYHAIHHELTPIYLTDELVDRYCSIHRHITFERNTLGSHLEEMTLGQPRALAWLTSVLDGTYNASANGCTITNVTVGEE